MRGLEVHRMPLGNMFEFALTGSTFVMLAYVGWSLRRNLRWLGLFVTGPAVLVLGLAITIWYVDGAELMPSLKSYWLVIHVTIATLSMALFDPVPPSTRSTCGRTMSSASVPARS